MEQPARSRSLPSARWTSFGPWNYNGMKERLKKSLANLNKDAILSHAEQIKGQRLTMSDSFSAGQFWICFEMIAEDSSLVIARVRLPRHPDTLSTVSEDDEFYSIACEVSTMRFVDQNLPIVVPKVYAYEGPGSQFATNAGAIYMLLEGFYGNTLQDIAPDLCSLPVPAQEHVMAQWTWAQAQLATLAFPKIGSISSITESGEPVIGKLSMAAYEGLVSQGPFSTATQYFTAIGEASLRKTKLCNGNLSRVSRLGALAFIDIVRNTDLFRESQAQYSLNHMDLGPQNILVDDDLNFLALIDWEFAQTAPWQVNYYPMPFPLLWSDERIKSALDDPEHVAHKNISRQAFARQLYSKKFKDAEIALREEGRPLGGSFAEALENPASRIYACFTRLAGAPEQDASHIREMVRLAFRLDPAGTDQYLKRIASKADETVEFTVKGDGTGL